MPTKVTDTVVVDTADAYEFTFESVAAIYGSVDVSHVVLGLRPQCRHFDHNIGK